ncbi:EF-hand calcium-binding domain-containing protein 1-like [Cephus cinctus]|uniref:EF-hand calcium-binding domain-containing protein 1-like n=1 Tax=Cephus cinctus TaxID=211228 RepID=A0AAJ7CAD2_CEPCN|nr:EF-hand calcium-binding domain-containing protein 1-like [Cephus cinctus]
MPAELPVDMLNASLKEIVVRRKNHQLFKKLAQQTHLNYREVEALALIHDKIVRVMGPVQRLVFRDVLHSGFDHTENIRHLLVDRIFAAMDKQNILQIFMDQWNEGMSIILRGTLNERINFGYRVYDLMKNNRIRKEQIFPIMRGCLIKQQPDEDPDEGVKDLIELMLKKLDVDRDGKVSFEDYSTAVKDRNALFLECIGPIFPSRDARNAFLTSFTDRTGRF